MKHLKRLGLGLLVFLFIIAMIGLVALILSTGFVVQISAAVVVALVISYLLGLAADKDA